ncbi:MAG: hypothetical protein RL017_215 [Pseudomonadota bacterium]|jgi:hypothetical protein|nr:DUF3579 domain-containing protein [Burkholderiales bacterium]
MQANNEVCYLDEIIIEGITVDGQKFRPSDWVDRLCGMLAVFDQQRVSYSNFLRPMVFKDMNCVAVKKELEKKKPSIFNFIMQFAADNQLKVIDGANFKKAVL